MTLDATIQLHRELYRSDIRIDRLVTRQPPTTLDVNTGQLHVEDGTRTGMNMSGRLLRYLGHPEGYGDHHQWSKALWLLKVECRRKHPSHRSLERPYWRGSLCWQAVKLVIIGGEAKGEGPRTPEQAAQILKLANIDALLASCFREIERMIDEADDNAIAREKQLESIVNPVNVAPRSPERHDMPGAHQLECPQCRKRGAA